jgi:hypothetical protein
MKNLLHTLTILSVASFAPSVTNAQSPSPEPDVILANATRCQRNTINVANLKQIARIKNERVFVIAHLGSGEVSQNLSRRRLKDIGAEFDQIGPMDRKTLILAEGERVKGQPRVEVYLGSELYFVSYIPRNGDFCSLCCDRRREFYKNRYNHRSQREKITLIPTSQHNQALQLTAR